jgi:hypothetical protein
MQNPSTGTGAVVTERCDGQSDAVLVDTVQDDDQPATVVSVETIDELATAMVVETVEEFSDDAMIRKILQEDLIASGRSTSELQEYIQHASLENVVSMMEEREFQAEEEKTERMGLDSAIAWAHLEYKHSLTAITQPATVPDEQATVVTITDHDIHPSDLSNADARAEFIGTDYSVRVVPDVPAVATAAAIGTAAEEDATEATVVDSKPAATPVLWSGEPTEEATVLDTKPPAEESWSRADEEQEVMVDGVVEEEATVVDITEDVHPADIERNDVFATLIGRDYTRGDSFSAPQQHRPPSLARRAVSDQPRAINPVDAHISDLFQHGIVALDSVEENNWMRRPSIFGEDDNVVLLPPPDTPAVAVSETDEQAHDSAPFVTAEIVDVDRDDMSVVSPLPARSPPTGRDGSNGTQDSARRAARNASLQMVRSFDIKSSLWSALLPHLCPMLCVTVFHRSCSGSMYHEKEYKCRGGNALWRQQTSTPWLQLGCRNRVDTPSNLVAVVGVPERIKRHVGRYCQHKPESFGQQQRHRSIQGSASVFLRDTSASNGARPNMGTP